MGSALLWSSGSPEVGTEPSSYKRNKPNEFGTTHCFGRSCANGALGSACENDGFGLLGVTDALVVKGQEPEFGPSAMT